VNSLLVGFLGALVGGLLTGVLALVGSRYQAQQAVRAAQIPERRALMDRKRRRLIKVFIPAFGLVSAIQNIMADQFLSARAETVEERSARHQQLIDDATQSANKTLPYLALEPGCEEVADMMRKLTGAFRRYQAKLKGGYWTADKIVEWTEAEGDINHRLLLWWITSEAELRR